MFSRPVLISMLCALALAGCATDDVAASTPLGGGGNGVAGDGAAPTSEGDASVAASATGDEELEAMPARPGCGDGVLTEDEACDDGGREAGDGCSANCLVVAPGFTCPTPGLPCRPFARCGDDVVAFPEQCDDGGREPGDGCSSNCKVEIGYKCDASGCTPTTCGDGMVEGAETCDDGNALSGDGCSAECVAEPDCTDQGCTSACGDGIVLGATEDCDDGNNQDGDGCSATCQVEQGYVCSQDADCDTGPTGECVLRAPTVFRDFSYDHPDFEETACGGTEATLGLVEDRLSAGKPVGTSGAMCTGNLHEWFADLPGTNVRLDDELVLYDAGDGSFVNRWGANGERWVTNVGWMCSQGGADCAFDGNPFFFPVDGIPGALDDGGETAAVSTTEYGMDGTTYTEQMATGSEPLRNFSFTTEVTYWFRFDTGMNANLEFIGDDDVWVFINGRLAVDLGGLHHAIRGDVTVNDASAAQFGLEDGGVYEIKVFQAERKAKGSTFKLTLSGFSTARSDCSADCGDGIIGFGEECDDGENDGGYNECQEGCVLGPYCGDGIVQEGEDCDDGNRVDGDECGSACRNIVII